MSNSDRPDLAAVEAALAAECAPLFWREIAGVKFYVRTLSSTEKNRLEAADWLKLAKPKKGADSISKKLFNFEGQGGFDARKAVVFLGYADNSRVYPDSYAETLGSGQPWPAKLVSEIVRRGLEHNGMTADAEEDAEKNSAPTPDSCSGTI